MNIDINDVTNSYNGGIGCACGCTGSYATLADKKATVALRVRKMNNANPADIAIFTDSRDETIYELYNDDRTRVTRLYVTNNN